MPIKTELRTLDFNLEPGWQQTEDMMLECLAKAAGNRYLDSWSSSNWALWEIERLRRRINEQGIYTDMLEKKLDDRQD